MSCCIVLGAQWGDEGKGKIVDLLSAEAEVVVRFQGGANAGHTIYPDGRKVVLHLVPSGILRQGCVAVIGNGCVVDIVELAEEIAALRNMGWSVSPDNLVLSPGAHLVTAMHRALDGVEGGKIGTTGRGIGPTYADKSRRVGIRIESLLDGSFPERFQALASRYRAQLHELTGEVPPDFVVPTEAVEVVRPFVRDARQLILDAARGGRNVLYEGAQGTLLDVDHGTWPFVTSSTTTIGGALSGAGVWVDFTARIGVVKAYTTRVGHGPFPTELHDEVGAALQERGKEFGATTGRPRRCGWLDLPLLRYAIDVNGLDRIALTKLDVLGGVDPIRVAVGRYDNGDPVYEDLPGWAEDITAVQRFADLPTACRDYVGFLEEQLGIPAAIVSTGAHRDHTLVRSSVW